MSVTAQDTNIRSTVGASGAVSGLTSVKAGLPPVVWLYLIAVVIPVGFNMGSVAMTGLRLLLFFTIIPMSISLFSGKYGKVYPVDYLFFFHIVWMTFALIANNPAGALQNVGSTAIEFLGGYVLARGCIRTPEAFAALIRAILILVILSLPLAIVEARTGTAVLPALIEKVPGLTSVAQVTIEKRLGLNRVQAYFSHPIHYGLFCSVAMSLIFVGMRNIMSLGKRIVSGMAITLGVFLSLSSGALLALMLQFALMSWNHMFRKVTRRWLLLLGLFALAYVVVDLLSNRTPVRVLMSYATFSAHTAYYRSIIFEWGMINVWNNPLLGLGFRNWIRPSFMHSGTVDNFWLVMAMRYGIPGFLLIAAGYADAIWRVGRQKMTPGTTLSDMRLAWMFTFLGLSFTLVTVHIWTSAYSFVFFLLGSGLWFASAVSGDSNATAPAVPTGPVHSRPSNLVLTRNAPEISRRSDSADHVFARSPVPESPTARGEATPRQTSRQLPYTRFPKDPEK
ncbi:MAG: O-antigen ligase family protein [Albidovulum sp.]